MRSAPSPVSVTSAPCIAYVLPLAIVVIASASPAGVAFAADYLDRQVQLDIGPQRLDGALLLFSKQADVQLMVDSSVVGEYTSKGIAGKLNADKALTSLLRGTNLEYETSGRTVTVKQRRVAEQRTRTAVVQNSELQSHEDERQSPAAGKAAISKDARSEKQSTREALEEVVVTGTNIRGVTSPASPVQIYDRGEIDLSGLGSVQEFVQRLPQNFGGIASEDTILNVAGGPGADNDVGGTGINLRGLGPDATLILINGHRIAPGNIPGSWTDVSMIPLDAVERVEVLPDGASAIYGADAVGGVVNFILRRHFDGAEGRVRYGSGSNGPDEAQAGLTLGHDWDSGSVLLSYEYSHRSELLASDRTFTRAAPAPFSLLPEQERHGAFVSLDRTINDRVDLFANGTFSRRDSVSGTTSTFGFSDVRRPTITAYTATLGGKANLTDRFRLELSSSYASSNTHERISELSSGEVFVDRIVDTSIMSIDGKVDGTLWSVPAGAVRVAIGGQFREEEYDAEGRLNRPSFQTDRDVRAGFLELQIPLIGAVTKEEAANQLELSLAMRAERYSDFGTSYNPKAGLVWQPSRGLKIRGTYGTSFKAPLLVDLDPAFDGFAAPESDPLTGGTTNTLVIFGGNPNLNPEKATTWTLGMDFQPERLPALRANLTYYNIHFKDRITDMNSAGFIVFDGLQFENIVGSSVVQRNPSLSMIENLVSNARRFDDYTGGDFMPNPGGLDLESIGAFIDSRQLNLSIADTSGVDAGLSYTETLAIGTLDVGVDATYILEFEHRFSAVSPVFDVRNSPYQPVGLKLRARGMLQRNGFNIAAFLNYTDSYSDTRSGVSIPVSSWTTMDLTVGYQFAKEVGFLSDVSTLLSVTNLTDEDPPFVAASIPVVFPGINFDGANANALGRVISFQISKRW